MKTAKATRPPLRVIQVVQDEPGGGPAHAELLAETLPADQVEVSIVRITPATGPGALRLAVKQVGAARAAAGGKPLLHVHGIRPTLPAAAIAKRHGLPLVTTVHGIHSIRRGDRGPVRLQNRVVLSAPDLVLAYSLDDVDTLLAKRLVKRDKLRHIRMAFPERALPSRAVARKRLGIPDDAIVLLWLGLVADTPKNVDTFTEAVTSMRTEPFVLVAGDGPQLDVVRGKLSGRSDRVLFTGWLEDPSDALAAGDLYTNISTWEGLSFASVEAARAGNAIVVSDVPGNRNLVRMKIATDAVPLRDAPALAAALDGLVADPTRLAAAGASARAAVTGAFPIEGLVDDVLDAYRTAAAKHQKR